MDGTPAGWYDDPEQPGQQRYWDGTAWTEQRAPGPAAPAAPTAPAAPPTMPPPGVAPAKKGNKALWIVLGVLGGFFVLVILAILAVTLLGGDSATEVVEENLPAALEDNYRAQGLDVTVSQVDCGSISNDDGPFTTTCSITISGLAEPIEATIYGTIDGNTVSVDDATSDQIILDETLAAEQAQPVVDSLDSTVSVLSCTLPAPVVIVTEGLTFTCDTDSDQTVTFVVENGSLSITDVS